MEIVGSTLRLATRESPLTRILGKPPCSRRITGLIALPKETNEDAEAEETPAPS
jgi:hypothetical protein